MGTFVARVVSSLLPAAPKDPAATLNQAEPKDAQADKLGLCQGKKSSSLPAAGNGLQTFSRGGGDME